MQALYLEYQALLLVCCKARNTRIDFLTMVYLCVAEGGR